MTPRSAALRVSLPLVAHCPMERRPPDHGPGGGHAHDRAVKRKARETEMGNKLFVGNLSFQTTEEALAESFGRFGEVKEAKIILDRETRRPRGFAFVTMGSDEEASEAIAGMNGADLDGRPLRVNEAEDRRGPRPGGGGGGGGGRRDDYGD